MLNDVEFQRFVGIIEIELRRMIHEVSIAVENKQNVTITQEIEKDDADFFDPYRIRIHPFSRPGETIITWTVKIVR